MLERGAILEEKLLEASPRNFYQFVSLALTKMTQGREVGS
jgi:hypothetical protein